MAEDLRSRLTQPGRIPFRYVPALDGVRGLGIIIVVWGHYSAGLSDWASTRFFGVQLTIDLFFVLSGFLITSLLIEEWSNRQRISLRNFYVRRGLRLLPALYVLLFVVVVIALTTDLLAPKLTVAEAAGAALYVYPIVLVAKAKDVFLTHLWTLSIEEWFYFAWPAFLIVVGLRPGTSKRFKLMVWALVGFCTLCFLTRIFQTRDNASLLVAAFRPDSLFYGSLLAFFVRWLNEFPHEKLEKVIAVLGPLSFAGFVYFSWLALFHQPPKADTVKFVTNEVSTRADKIKELFYKDSFQSWNYQLGIWCCFGMILHLVRTPSGRLSKFFSWRPFVYVGILSYAIYLWHQVLFQLAIKPQLLNIDVAHEGHRVLSVPEMWGIGVAIGLVSLLVAIVSRRFVEVPALRLKKRFEVVHYESKR